MPDQNQPTHNHWLDKNDAAAVVVAVVFVEVGAEAVVVEVIDVVAKVVVAETFG